MRRAVAGSCWRPRLPKPLDARRCDRGGRRRPLAPCRVRPRRGRPGLVTVQASPGVGDPAGRGGRAAEHRAGLSAAARSCAYRASRVRTTGRLPPATSRPPLLHAGEMGRRASLPTCAGSTRLPLLRWPPRARNLRALGALDADGRITAQGRGDGAAAARPGGRGLWCCSARRCPAPSVRRRRCCCCRNAGWAVAAKIWKRACRRWRGERGGARRGKPQAGGTVGCGCSKTHKQLPRVEQMVPLAIILAAGRPGFVAKRRDTSGEDWLAANGRGYRLDPTSPVAWCPEYVRDRRCARVLRTGRADNRCRRARKRPTCEQWLGERIGTRTARCAGPGERIEARREERLGALVLSKGTGRRSGHGMRCRCCLWTRLWRTWSYRNSPPADLPRPCPFCKVWKVFDPRKPCGRARTCGSRRWWPCRRDLGIGKGKLVDSRLACSTGTSASGWKTRLPRASSPSPAAWLRH